MSQYQKDHLTIISNLVLTELIRCYPNLTSHTNSLQTKMLANTQFNPDTLAILDEQVKNHNQYSSNTSLINQLDELFLQVDKDYSEQRQAFVNTQKTHWDELADEMDDRDSIDNMDEELDDAEFLQQLDLDEETIEEAMDLFGMLKDMEQQIENAKPVAIAFAQSHKHSLNNVLTLLDMMYPLDTLMTTSLIDDNYCHKLSYNDAYPIRFAVRGEDALNMAQKVYDKLLTLPDTYHVVDELGLVEEGTQAVQAQFWTYALLANNIDNNNALTTWQLQTLKNVPDKLFMFSWELTGIPAHWWANLAAKSQPAKTILRSKSDESLTVALDRIDNEQEISNKISDVMLTGADIGILPLEEVGFSDAQNELIAALNQLTKVLQTHFTDLELNTSTDVDMKAIEDKLDPLQFSEDIKVFYHWSLQFGNRLEEFFAFPSIEPLIQAYRFTLEIMQDADNLWSKVLFSFAYESQTHLITPLSEKPAASGMIYFIDIVGGDFEGYYDSVLGMVNTYLEFYTSDVSHIDEGYVNYDEDVWNNLRLKHNPKAYNTHNEGSRTKTNYIEYWEVDTWFEEWRKYQVGEVME